MTRDEFITKMIEKGKMRPEALEKIKAKNDAKTKYKAEKSKLTKTELQTLLDVLTQLSHIAK